MELSIKELNMKQLIISVVLVLGIGYNMARAEEVPEDIKALRTEISMLQTKQEQLTKEVKALSRKSERSCKEIKKLEFERKQLWSKIDSLHTKCCTLEAIQENDKSELEKDIDQTKERMMVTETVVSSRTIWGVCGVAMLLLLIGAVVWAFLRKFKSGSTSIDDVRKAQDALKDAQEGIRKVQERMLEESIQLDNKLIEILSRQPVASPTTNDSGEMDHSLTLKVADEIVKIEMNLSRMDESIKGYKQLSKGVQRIKDNFRANDYEIVDMLGMPYQQGMKAAVTFVTDESLEPGKQIITRIIKPQVNYKQVMIQAAQIEVSQSE